MRACLVVSTVASGVSGLIHIWSACEGAADWTAADLLVFRSYLAMLLLIMLGLLIRGSLSWGATLFCCEGERATHPGAPEAGHKLVA